MKKLGLIVLLFAFVQCEEVPRDVSHCKESPTECDQYSCYFLSCDCVPEEGTDDPYAPRFSTDRAVTSEAVATEIALAFMEMLGDTTATINRVGEHGYGWYFATFNNVQNSTYEHIVISPKGNVYIVGCGV